MENSSTYGLPKCIIVRSNEEVAGYQRTPGNGLFHEEFTTKFKAVLSEATSPQDKYKDELKIDCICIKDSTVHGTIKVNYV
jgi:hypothetical protein